MVVLVRLELTSALTPPGRGSGVTEVEKNVPDVLHPGETLIHF